MKISGKHDAAVLILLLTLVVSITADLVKFSGPQFDFLLSTQGVAVAAGTALGVYALPAIITWLLGSSGGVGGHAILRSVTALVLLRVVMQFLSGTPLLIIGLLAVSAALSTSIIVAAAVSRFGGRTVAWSLTAGLFLSSGISLTLKTFEPIWRSDVAGYLALTVALVLVSTAAILSRNTQVKPYSRGLWVLGPVISLGVTVFANPAFLASQSGLLLWSTSLPLIAGIVLAAQFVRVAHRVVLPLALIAVAAVATIYCVPRWPEPQTLLVGIVVYLAGAILAGAAAALVSLAANRSVVGETRSRLAGVSAGGGLLTILPTLLYQLDYDIPLPFPNEFVMVGLVAIIAFAAVFASRAEQRNGRLPRTIDPAITTKSAVASLAACIAVPAALTVAGALTVLPSSKGTPESSSTSELTLIDWNLHYGVSLNGEVTWDEMVDVIKDSQADIVTLQEISRGWVMGGGGDMLSYLSDELDMQYAFVGAADLQFGNALMWRDGAELTDIARTALAYGDGPQNRSALSGRLAAEGGEIVIATAHLQHRDENTPTRLLQLDEMFANLGIREADQVVVTGDFNAEPGWPEILKFTSANFTSVIDEVGDPNAMTFPAINPNVRIDWVFTKGVSVLEADVPETPASDHLPIITRFSLNGS